MAMRKIELSALTGVGTRVAISWLKKNIDQSNSKNQLKWVARTSSETDNQLTLSVKDLLHNSIKGILTK